MTNDDDPFAPPRADHPAADGGRLRMAVLRTYPLAAMAELDRGLLADHGIVAIVESGDVFSFSAIGQAILLVRPEDHPSALALLEAPVFEDDDVG